MKLVNQKQAAAALGVTDRTIRNLISRGVLTGYMVPGLRAVRLDLDEIRLRLKTIPAVRAEVYKKPFGPKARIVPAPIGAPIVAEVVERTPEPEVEAEGGGAR